MKSEVDVIIHKDEVTIYLNNRVITVSVREAGKLRDQLRELL